jgi:molybdopterin molybdotransferase
MISVEEALQRVLSNVSVLPTEDKYVLDTMGQVLAEDIVSSLDIPPYNNSAMDGYAVRAADITAATASNPVSLRVIGDLAAGYVTDIEVTPGSAIRIMTGAPIPNGADAVVPFEETDEGVDKSKPRGATVAIMKAVEVCANVRNAGEDVRKGELVLHKGTPIRPSEIGVLASLGCKQVKVIRRPRVVILSTGDELVEIDAPLAPGKIRNSNSYSLAAMVERCGGIPIRAGIVKDRLEEVTASLREAAGADLILTSGGVSMGDFDVVKDAMKTEGEVTFWQVCMKPGKPLAFGQIGGVPLLGLPGNPVSAMVSFEQFGRPAILKMLGKTVFQKPQVEAIIHGQARNKDGRRNFLRAFVENRNGEWHARLASSQSSGVLTSMVLANGLAILPEEEKAVKDGDRLKVIMLDWPEEVTCVG